MTETNLSDTAPDDAVQTDRLRWNGVALLVLGLIGLLTSLAVKADLSFSLGVLLLLGSFVHLKSNFLAFGSVALALLYALVGVLLTAVSDPLNQARLLVAFFLVTAYVEVDGWYTVRRLDASAWFLVNGVLSLMFALSSSALPVYADEPEVMTVGVGLLLGIHLSVTGCTVFLFAVRNRGGNPVTVDREPQRTRFRRYVFAATAFLVSLGVFLGGAAASRSLDRRIYELLSRLPDWQQTAVFAGSVLLLLCLGAFVRQHLHRPRSVRTPTLPLDRPTEVGVGVPFGAFVGTLLLSWVAASAVGDAVGWLAPEATPAWVRLIVATVAATAVGWIGAQAWSVSADLAESMYPLPVADDEVKSADAAGGSSASRGGDIQLLRGIAGYLQTAIYTLRTDLKQHEDELTAYEPSDHAAVSGVEAEIDAAKRRIVAARDQLVRAETRLENGDLLFCLQYYYDARAELAFVFRALDEVQDTPTTGRLKEEAVKTIEVGEAYLGSEWADRTRAELLTKQGNLRQSVTPTMVQNRRAAVNSEVVGELETVLLVRRLLTFSASVIVFALLSFGVALLSGVELSVGPAGPYREILQQDAFFGLVFLLGAVGSAINTIRTWSDQVMTMKQIQTPAQLSISQRVIAVRALVGGTAAVFIYLFLVSGIVAPQLVTPGLVLAAAVVAGFSDQLFLAAMEKITSVIGPQNADAKETATGSGGAGTTPPEDE